MSSDKPIFLRILIFTADHPRKVDPMISGLLSKEPLDAEVVVVASKPGEPSIKHKRLSTRHFPEPSTHHLRRHIPALSRNSIWTLVLEDHNLVDENYLSRLLDVLKQTPADARLVYGAIENLTSTDAWSWANFLFVAAKHWPPTQQTPNEHVIFNAAYRSEFFPEQDYCLGEFETIGFPSFLDHKIFSSSFKIDHKQFRMFPSVLYYHFCNGRAISGNYRNISGKEIGWAARHGARVLFKRFFEIKRIAANHERRDQLPRGTLMRLWMLCLAHSLGALWGAIFGTDKAMESLE